MPEEDEQLQLLPRHPLSPGLSAHQTARSVQQYYVFPNIWLPTLRFHLIGWIRIRFRKRS